MNINKKAIVTFLVAAIAVCSFTGCGGGGGSGGGSVNIFATTMVNEGSIVANGGTRGNATRSGGEKVNGGAGGNGTVTFMEIEIANFGNTYRANSNFFQNSNPQEIFDYTTLQKLLEG